MPAKLARHHRRKWLSTRPSVGYGIDPSSSLVDGMFDCLVYNEGAGDRLTNLAAPGAAATFNSPSTLIAHATWAATPDGPGVSCAGASDDTQMRLPDRGNLAAGDLTLRLRIYPRSWGGTYTSIFGKGGDAGEATAFVNTSGALQWVALGGSATDSLSRGNLVPGSVHDLVITRQGTTVQAYVDGRAAGATWTNSGTAASAGAPLNLGFTSNTKPNAIYLGFQSWKGRALMAGEVAQLWAEPYSFLLASPTRRFFTVAAGAGGGAQSVAVPVAVLHLAGVAPTVTPGAVARTVPLASVALSALAPLVTVGPISRAVPTAILHLGGIAPNPTLTGYAFPVLGPSVIGSRIVRSFILAK